MFFFVQGDEVPEPRAFCQPEWEQIGWRWVGRRLMESPLPSTLFPSLSDSLWRGLWRQTGHLLGSGDWGRQSKVNTCPSPGVQHTGQQGPPPRDSRPQSLFTSQQLNPKRHVRCVTFSPGMWPLPAWATPSGGGAC